VEKGRKEGKGAAARENERYGVDREEGRKGFVGAAKISGGGGEVWEKGSLFGNGFLGLKGSENDRREKKIHSRKRRAEEDGSGCWSSGTGDASNRGV